MSSGNLGSLEGYYPDMLLAYLAAEIDSTVPSDHLTRRARRLLDSAEEALCNICDYDRWDEMASDIHKQWQEKGI